MFLSNNAFETKVGNKPQAGYPQVQKTRNPWNPQAQRDGQQIKNQGSFFFAIPRKSPMNGLILSVQALDRQQVSTQALLIPAATLIAWVSVHV